MRLSRQWRIRRMRQMQPRDGSWSPYPPDRSDIVAEVHDLYPQLLQYNTKPALGEFLQRVCALDNQRYPNDRMGLLSKTEGENHHTYPNGQMCAVDVVAFPDGNRIDVVQGSDAHPTPAGPAWIPIPPDQWRPHNTYVDVSSWPIYDSGTPSDITDYRAALGRGWFCALRILHDWPQEFADNWKWILDNEDPDFFRILGDVEGEMHKGAVGIDPWRDAGCSYRDPWWPDALKHLLDVVGDVEKGLEVTMYGGRARFPTRDEMARYHDAFVAACAGRWAGVKGIEVANEYNVNGWSDVEVQWCGEDLRAKLPPGMPLALSAPGHPDSNSNEEMLASMERLYGPAGGYHYGADRMTVHLVRDQSSKWSDPFSYNNMFVELKKSNNEPRGPGASTGGDVNDPALLIGDYQLTSEAAWGHYNGHGAWSIFGGHMPQEWIDYYYVHNGPQYAQQRTVRFLKDLPNQPATSQGFDAYHDSGTGYIPTPKGRSVLMGGEELKGDEMLVSNNGQYRLLYQLDGNLVLYGPPDGEGAPTWNAGTAGTTVNALAMQNDGNLVVYDASGAAVWNSGTAGHDGAMCQLQDDGMFVIYADPHGPDAGKPLWSAP